MAALELVLKDTPVDLEAARTAMETLEPDIADFRIMGKGNDLLAAAFSANDVESTAMLFNETGWRSKETTLLYHPRPDRPVRLRGFLPWITSLPWREVVFTRTARPFFPFSFIQASRLKWEDSIRDPDSFTAWREGRGQIFACGNVAGWPLEYLLANRGV